VPAVSRAPEITAATGRSRAFSRAQRPPDLLPGVDEPRRVAGEDEFVVRAVKAQGGAVRRSTSRGRVRLAVDDDRRGAPGVVHLGGERAEHRLVGTGG